jgi:hypothetical protein
MTQPTAYNPATAFGAFAPAGFPNLGTNLDTEFQNLNTTIDQTLANLALIQNDATGLANLIVTPDSLSTLTRQLFGTTGWEPKGAWLTATGYVLKDVVSQGGIGYVCMEAHTSGVFATDLTAVKWLAFSQALTTSAFGLSWLNTADATSAMVLLALTISSFGRTLIDDADAAAARTTLGAEQILNNLTTETVISLSDLIPMVDASESNASNKITTNNLLSGLMALATDTTPTGADQVLYEILARKISDGVLHRFLPSEIGVGKQSIWVPSTAMTPRTTNGAASGSVETTTNKVMIKSLDFDPTTQEFAQFQIQMPKSWNVGTFTAIFVWSHPSTTVNFGVVWGIEALALSDDDAMDTAFGTSVTSTDTGGTTNKKYRSPETGAITASNSPAANDVIVYQVHRDPANGSDTMAVDARLHGVLLFYTTNANTDN